MKAFLKKISSSAPGGKSDILKIPVWKLYECPSLPAGKFIQLLSLLKYYSQLKIRVIICGHPLYQIRLTDYSEVLY
jgi:hypothetical protein